MLKLLIARHGNTFDKGETVTRVGARTDLPLSKSGQQQAKLLSNYLQLHYPTIDKVICSELKRTMQTATIATSKHPLPTPVSPLALFNEIDYGPDENQPEEKVIARIGEKALQAWDENAKVPSGWLIAPEALKKSLSEYFKHLASTELNKTILIVTSNGIARFIPFLLVNNETFLAANKLKLATGSISEFEFKNGHWQCNYWGKRL